MVDEHLFCFLQLLPTPIGLQCLEPGRELQRSRLRWAVGRLGAGAITVCTMHRALCEESAQCPKSWVLFLSIPVFLPCIFPLTSILL